MTRDELLRAVAECWPYKATLGHTGSIRGTRSPERPAKLYAALYWKETVTYWTLVLDDDLSDAGATVVMLEELARIGVFYAISPVPPSSRTGEGGDRFSITCGVSGMFFGPTMAWAVAEALVAAMRNQK